MFYLLGTGRSRALALVRARTEELEFRALHDSLTGLPNRPLVLDRVGQLLARSEREGTRVAALTLDLDNFKDINDSLGHGAGDELLVAVGTRLVGALRGRDTVGRLGGDEFVVLVEGDGVDSGAGPVAQKILDLFEEPIRISACLAALPVSVSIGIAEGDCSTADGLLRDADVARHRAKEGGKNRAAVYSRSMQDEIDHSRSLVADLRGALDAGEFFVVYQPVFDLSSGSLFGVEALLRWQHPARGVVAPLEFVPVLESTGLIVPVGRWVLEQACRQGARWQDRGHRVALAVNVSGRQLERDAVVDDVDGALSASGLDPGVLIVELTETALMQDVPSIVGRLDLLKSLGVSIAVDDFGMGYSSISYLEQFPVDILKIDQSFVSRIADSSESAALVHSLVQLGKALGLRTVAEGIETDVQRLRLKAEAVDYGQGFLFAPPLDGKALDLLIETAGVARPPAGIGGR